MSTITVKKVPDWVTCDNAIIQWRRGGWRFVSLSEAHLPYWRILVRAFVRRVIRYLNQINERL